MATRTTHRSTAGKKLYARRPVREDSRTFRPTSERTARDLKSKSGSERVAARKKAAKKHCVARAISTPVLSSVVLAAAVVWGLRPPARAQSSSTAWPGGARMALSLSFDDGRESQVTQGLPVFARHGVKVTLFVVPSAVEPSSTTGSAPSPRATRSATTP